MRPQMVHFQPLFNYLEGMEAVEPPKNSLLIINQFLARNAPFRRSQFNSIDQKQGMRPQEPQMVHYQPLFIYLEGIEAVEPSKNQPFELLIINQFLARNAPLRRLQFNSIQFNSIQLTKNRVSKSIFYSKSIFLRSKSLIFHILQSKNNFFNTYFDEEDDKANF